MWLGISLFHLFFLRYIICWGSVDSCFSYQFYKFTAIIFKITFFSSIWYILDLSFHSPCPISQFFSITSSLCMIVLIWDNFLRYIFQYANSLFFKWHREQITFKGYILLVSMQYQKKRQLPFHFGILRMKHLKCMLKKWNIYLVWLSHMVDLNDYESVVFLGSKSQY